MNDYLAESRGTLARTAQKKQTAISQYHRQQQLRKKEEKYGFAVRPSNPNIVDRPDAIEFYFKEVYGETSNKVSQLQQLDAAAIDREGEGPIRKMNKEARELILERARWGRRFVEVGGHVPEIQLNPSKKMEYFGAAKYLPEAIKAALNAGDAEKEEDEENAYMSDGEEDVGIAQSTTTPQPLGNPFDEEESALTKTTRWLSLTPQEAITAAVIQGFSGLEFSDSDERRLRYVEAVALQRARKFVASSSLSNQSKQPSRSESMMAEKIAGEEVGDEEDNDYNPEMTKRQSSHHHQVGLDRSAAEEEGEDDENHGGDHLNEVATRLLGMQVLQYHNQSAVTDDDEVQNQKNNHNVGATNNLPSEKEVQARVFAAKKAMMLEQLNRKRLQGGGGN